jgi:hypothetical protein
LACIIPTVIAFDCGSERRRGTWGQWTPDQQIVRLHNLRLQCRRRGAALRQQPRGNVIIPRPDRTEFSLTRAAAGIRYDRRAGDNEQRLIHRTSG